MPTAIIGLGQIGQAIATNLAATDEQVLLVAHDLDRASEIADRIGGTAQASRIESAIEAADTVVLAVSLHSAVELLSDLQDGLAGKVVIDPSNPLEITAGGEFRRTLPEGETAAGALQRLLPHGAHFAKAFSTLPSDALVTARDSKPEPIALFYVAFDETADTAVSRLIRLMGFEPIRLEGDGQVQRIEFGGDLGFQILAASEARSRA